MKKVRIPKKRKDGVVQRYWIAIARLIKNPIFQVQEVVEGIPRVTTHKEADTEAGALKKEMDISSLLKGRKFKPLIKDKQLFRDSEGRSVWKDLTKDEGTWESAPIDIWIKKIKK